MCCFVWYIPKICSVCLFVKTIIVFLTDIAFSLQIVYVLHIMERNLSKEELLLLETGQEVLNKMLSELNAEPRLAELNKLGVSPAMGKALAVGELSGVLSED